MPSPQKPKTIHQNYFSEPGRSKQVSPQKSQF
jgi:hypothetical protein